MECAGRDAIVEVDDRRHLSAVFRRKTSGDKCDAVDNFWVDDFIQSSENPERNRNAVDVVRELAVLSADVYFSGRSSRRSHQIFLDNVRHPGRRGGVECLRFEHLVRGHRVDI